MSYFFKNFSKIILLFFVFFMSSFFISQNKTQAAFIVDPATPLVRNCVGTTTSATLYVIDTSNLTGTLPLCLQDNDVGQTLTIRDGRDVFIYSTTSIGSSNNEGKIFYDYTATIEQTPSPFPSLKYFDFVVSDVVAQTTPSTFALTLLPAYKVKFLNASSTDGVTTDEFSSLTVGGNSKNVASPYITVYQNSTSTSEALGGTPSNPANVSVTGGT